MGMNQQFGSAAFAFVKLIDSNLKKNVTTLNGKWLIVKEIKTDASYRERSARGHWRDIPVFP